MHIALLEKLKVINVNFDDRDILHTSSGKFPKMYNLEFIRCHTMLSPPPQRADTAIVDGGVGDW